MEHFPRLAKGAIEERIRIYLSLEDNLKIKRGPEWEEVVTDQMTGTFYHIQGQACGLNCYCDLLVWPVTADELKAFREKQRADLVKFYNDMQNAVVTRVDGVYRIVDANGKDIFADDDGYETREAAVEELARERDRVGAELNKPAKSTTLKTTA